MIVSVLYLFKIHREVVFGNSTVVVEDMLGKTPEPLNAIDMILCSLVDQRFGMIHGMMLPESFEGMVAFEGV